MAASFFWDQVLQHHSYATGDNGHDEYFGEPGKLGDRVDGQRIGHQEMTRSRPPRFLDVVYPIDSSIVNGKKQVTVRFEAEEGNAIASVFGIRMICRDTNN